MLSVSQLVQDALEEVCLAKLGPEEVVLHHLEVRPVLVPCTAPVHAEGADLEGAVHASVVPAVRLLLFVRADEHDQRPEDGEDVVAGQAWAEGHATITLGDVLTREDLLARLGDALDGVTFERQRASMPDLAGLGDEDQHPGA